VLLLVLVAFDIVATKLDLVDLRAPRTGIEEVGFDQPIQVFGPNEATGNELTVAVLGDSHHMFSRRIAETHQSPILHDLLEQAGVANRVVSLGVPRYSLTQELVAYEALIKPEYEVDVAVFLMYGGNDFAELLRDDDRPRTNRDSDGKPYIAAPNWLVQRTPEGSYRRWPQDSRLLYLVNSATPHNAVLKLMAADRALEVFEPSIWQRLEFALNLLRFTDERLGYPGAIPAQFLYQHYLNFTYPEAFKREVGWRIDHFCEELCRRNSTATPIYLFYLPSAPAAGALPELDQLVLDDVLARTGLDSIDFVAREHELLGLVESSIRRCSGTIELVDLTPAIRDANREDGTQSFYDEPTIHIDTKARRVVAEEMARVLLARFREATDLPVTPHK